MYVIQHLGHLGSTKQTNKKKSWQLQILPIWQDNVALEESKGNVYKLCPDLRLGREVQKSPQVLDVIW